MKGGLLGCLVGFLCFLCFSKPDLDSLVPRLTHLLRFRNPGQRTEEIRSNDVAKNGKATITSEENSLRPAVRMYINAPVYRQL